MPFDQEQSETNINYWPSISDIFLLLFIVSLAYSGNRSFCLDQMEKSNKEYITSTTSLVQSSFLEEINRIRALFLQSKIPDVLELKEIPQKINELPTFVEKKCKGSYVSCKQPHIDKSLPVERNIFLSVNYLRSSCGLVTLSEKECLGEGDAQKKSNRWVWPLLEGIKEVHRKLSTYKSQEQRTSMEAQVNSANNAKEKAEKIAQEVSEKLKALEERMKDYYEDFDLVAEVFTEDIIKFGLNRYKEEDMRIDVKKYKQKLKLFQNILNEQGNKNKRFILDVYGHTDETGGTNQDGIEYNVLLGFNRARSMSKKLERDLGYPKNIEFRSFSAGQFVAPDNSGEEKKRVEVKMKRKEKQCIFKS